jgi:translation initiation factor IF-3
MIMVLGPHKKKTEAMAEARQAQEARKADAKANPGKSQNAAESEHPEDEAAIEAPAEASAEA